MAYCTKCGMNNLEGAKYCKSCGGPIELTPATPAQQQPYPQPAPMYQPPQPQYPPQQPIQTQYQQPIPPQYQQQPQQLPVPGKSASKKSFIMIGVIAVVIVVVLVLAIVLMRGSSMTSPQGTMNSMLSAFNNYDAKGIIDCTVMKFYSTAEYASAMNSIQSACDSMKAASVHATMTIVTVKYSAQMTSSETSDVNDAVDDLTDHGAQVVVEDSCVTSYTITITGVGYPNDTTTLSGVLLKINGLWYSDESPVS